MPDAPGHGERRPPRARLILALAALALSAAAVAGAPTLCRHRAAAADTPTSLVARGAVLFATSFTPAQGLGPLFNNTSCLGCHSTPTPGGMGPDGLGIATRVGQLSPSGFDAMIGRGGPVMRSRSVAELGQRCDLEPGIPAGANVTSVRNAPGLYGSGLIDAIPDEAIAAGAVDRGDGVHGRAHRVRGADGRERIGRFGWKADTVSLRQFVADAFRNELGITSPLASVDLVPAAQPGRRRCPGEGARLEDDGRAVVAVTAFLAALAPPPPRTVSAAQAALFASTGCAACHTPALAGVPLYSDMLLHDVGADLDDKVTQGQASGRNWRTTPLWGLGARRRLLHDGRARTIALAILAHGGEAATARQRFRELAPADREALLAFLGGL